MYGTYVPALLSECSYLPPRRRLGTGYIETPPVRLSVRHVSFSHCNSKTHCCIFSNFCRHVQFVMAVVSLYAWYGRQRECKWFHQLVDTLWESLFDISTIHLYYFSSANISYPIHVCLTYLPCLHLIMLIILPHHLVQISSAICCVMTISDNFN